MRIKTVYGLAALFKYYENIHSEYDRSLILETLAEKYFSNAIYKTDEDIVLNINGITLTEEEAVALVYDILVRSASYSSIHGYDLVKTIRKPDYFRLGIISYDLDTAKILSEIKKKLPNLPEDVRLRGRKLAGTISDVAKRNDKAAEACIGVTVLKSVDAEGQKRIDILCGAFADEFNTCAMLEHLGKSTDVKKIPKIFRKTEQYYRQQNCEKIMNDYFSTIGNMCDKHTEVISTYFAILRDDKYDELTGAELRWRKPEIVEAGNVIGEHLTGLVELLEGLGDLLLKLSNLVLGVGELRLGLVDLRLSEFKIMSELIELLLGRLQLTRNLIRGGSVRKCGRKTDARKSKNNGKGSSEDPVRKTVRRRARGESSYRVHVVPSRGGF